MTKKQLSYIQDICKVVAIDEDPDMVLKYSQSQAYDFIDKYDSVYYKYLQYKQLGLSPWEAKIVIEGEYTNCNNEYELKKWLNENDYHRCKFLDCSSKNDFMSDILCDDIEDEDFYELYRKGKNFVILHENWMIGLGRDIYVFYHIDKSEPMPKI